MKIIDIKTSQHNFEKQNLVTKKDDKGMFDLLKCTLCGLTGKRRNFTHIEVNKDKNCKGVKAVQVRIVKCHGVGSQFANLIPGSVHQIVTPPDEYKEKVGWYWLMGVGEKVRILPNEFEIID